VAGVIEVAIVDDHPLYRRGLAAAVQQADELTVVAEAASIEEFDAASVATDVVVLLDLHLPGIEGAEGVAHVHGLGHRVIVVSAAGAPEDVIDAVAAGQTYVSPTLASYLIRVNKQKSIEEEFRLSPRELEILALVASGETDRDIAKQLYIATATVYSHLERIRDKTGARRRAQLTRLYLERQDRKR
jgi:DNA-binding NarL/FixJ family response regulator